MVVRLKSHCIRNEVLCVCVLFKGRREGGGGGGGGVDDGGVGDATAAVAAVVMETLARVAYL